MIPFNPAPMTSYKHSIVTIGISHTVSEINGDFRGKQPIFPISMYLTPLLKGFPWNWVSVQGSEETRMTGLSGGRKSYRFSHFDTILTRDRQTSSQPVTLP